MLLEEFMNRLKLLREEKGLFQSDIGKIIGVSSQAVGHYESGKRDMSTDIIIKLANYFNVTTDYLLGVSNNRKETTSLNLDGLSKDDINEIEKQIEYLKWKNNNQKS